MRSADLTRRAALASLGAVFVACRYGSTRIVRPSARGDGRTDDRAEIQRAIDECARRGGGVVVLPAGTFLLGAVPYVRPDGTAFGAACLVLRDRVELRGIGDATVLRPVDNAYGPGALFRVIGSHPGGLSDVAIRALTVDGKRRHQIANTQAGNIMLECTTHVRIEDVRSIEANGTAIMLFGEPTRPASELYVRRCRIESAAYIGIQASQFVGCQIIDNAISDTVDNAIDVYGDNGTTTTTSRDFEILGNRVSRRTIGIFVETCREGRVAGNSVEATVAGVGVNRIHGEPREIEIIENQLAAPVGVRISGDTGGVSVARNRITGFTQAGIQVGLADGNVSHVDIEKNEFDTDDANARIVAIRGHHASFVTARGNRISGTPPRELVDSSATMITNVELDHLLGD